VASVFGQVQVERWDAPLVQLPDRDAVRDYLIARFVAPDAAVAAADRVATPVTVTKRGAVVYARKWTAPQSAWTNGTQHAALDCPRVSTWADPISRIASTSIVVTTLPRPRRRPYRADCTSSPAAVVPINDVGHPCRRSCAG
jgi:hypothetical protein